MTIDKVRELKTKIDQAKQEKARAEGRLEEILDRWEKDYGVRTPEEIEKKQAEIQAKIEDLKKKYDKYIQEIEEAMPNVT